MTEAKEHKRNQKRRRESRYVRVARIAYAIAQEALPRYSHPKSPHICTLPQLAACVLLGFYLSGVDQRGLRGGDQNPADPGLADGEGAGERCALPSWAQAGDPALWAQGGRETGLAAFGRQRLRWCGGRRGGPGPSHPAGREPAGPKAAGTGGACGLGSIGRDLWAVVEERDGAVGDQAEVRGHDSVEEALSAAEGGGD